MTSDFSSRRYRQFLDKLRERPVRTDLTPVKSEAQKVTDNTDFQVIQVVGTNGKGSVVHYLVSLLEELDEEIVALTSPHLAHPGERILINNQPLSEKQFVEKLDSIPRRWLEEYTPFEIFFLLTLKVAAARAPDYLLLEAGMGGRWDATSALPADITVLTSVEFEHTEFLGETKREIIEEKTAQVPEETVLFSPPFAGELNRYLKKLSRQRNLNFYPLEQFSEADSYNRYISLRVAEFLKSDSGEEIEQIVNKISRPPGRQEKLRLNERDCLLDVAHTPAAIAELTGYAQKLFAGGAVDIVFGCLQKKKYKKMVNQLVRSFEKAEYFFVPPPSPRAISPKKLLKVVPAGVKARKFKDLKTAARELKKKTKAGKNLIIAGSFSLVGWFRQKWKK
ncbi:MAG: glutamate ligase domain-containing protein [bacterium]